MLGNGAVGTEHAGSDSELPAAKDVACEEVDDAEDEGKNARGNDYAPVVSAKRLLACGLLVKIAEDGDTQNDHHEAESNEAGGGREKRPVVGNVVAEEREFGDDEKYADEGRHDMANAVEEEELGDNEGLDEHDGACSDDGDESYDVHYADCVEYNVARPGQGAFEKRHS